MAVLPVFWAFVLLIVALQGYKWYRIHQLNSSGDPTPPSFWTLTVWPWLAAGLFFLLVLVWALIAPHR
jgi:hypothetical protein